MYDDVVLQDAPAIFWQFTQAELPLGPVTDLSGNGRDGTVTDSDGGLAFFPNGWEPYDGWYFRRGPGGGDGSAPWVQAARDATLDDDGTTGCTLELIFTGEKNLSPDTFEDLVSYEFDADGRGVYVMVHESTGALRVNYATTTTDFITDLLDGFHHHVIVRYDRASGDLDLWVDGELAETAAIGAGLTQDNEGADRFGVGPINGRVPAEPHLQLGSSAFYPNQLLTDVDCLHHGACANAHALKGSEAKGGSLLKGAGLDVTADVDAADTDQGDIVFEGTAQGTAYTEGYGAEDGLIIFAGEMVAVENNPTWRAILTDADGAQVGEVDAKYAVRGGKQLDGIGGASLSFAREDDHEHDLSNVNEALFSIWERELQLWRGRQLLWWGPILRPRSSGDRASVQAQEAPFHLTRRSVGPLIPADIAVNGDFNRGFFGWRPVAVNGFVSTATWPDPTYMQVVTGGTGGHPAARVGAQMVQLTHTAALDDAGQFVTLTQVINPSFIPADDGFDVNASVWVYVPSSSYTRPNIKQSGMILGRTDAADISAGGVFDATQIKDLSVVRIDDSTPKDQWLQLTGKMRLFHPPDEVLVVRIDAPVGVAYYDHLQVFVDEYVDYNGSDQCKIISGLVDLGQDATYDKSDVNISVEDAGTPAGSGGERTRRYHFLRRPNVWTEVRAFTRLVNGVELRTRYTPTERIIQCAPRVGQYRPKHLIALGRNLARYDYAKDGTQGANAVGVSAGTEVAAASDTTAFGGVTVEKFVALTEEEAGPETIEGVAERQLVRAKNPQIVTATVQETPTPFIGQVDVGDFVPVRIYDDLVDVDAIYQVTALSFEVQEDRLELTLNYHQDRADRFSYEAS